ncbi:MAG: hypothetical protein Q4D82_08030, partial [Neisseria sp.]|nr:hypothetical protein [Neisseria sp.]
YLTGRWACAMTDEDGDIRSIGETQYQADHQVRGRGVVDVLGVLRLSAAEKGEWRIKDGGIEVHSALFDIRRETSGEQAAYLKENPDLAELGDLFFATAKEKEGKYDTEFYRVEKIFKDSFRLTMESDGTKYFGKCNRLQGALSEEMK